jgi:hypothetical protein
MSIIDQTKLSTINMSPLPPKNSSKAKLKGEKTGEMREMNIWEEEMMNHAVEMKMKEGTKPDNYSKF